MNSTPIRLTLITIFGCLALCLLVHAAEPRFVLPPENNKLKPGPGSELVTSQCLICHSADYIATQPRLTRAVWQAEITKMQQKYGAPIATNSVSAMVDYLTRNYGQEVLTNVPAKK